MKDSIFKSSGFKGKFMFDQKVADVFDDMLLRSIPLYNEAQKMIADIASVYYKKGTRIYDLGCSTGATIVSLCSVIDDPGLAIVGIDSSEPIIRKAGEKLAGLGLQDKADLICEDVAKTGITNASVVIMNYTLQFVPPESRKRLVGKIYDSLDEGGVLIVSDKVLEKDESTSDLFIEKYHDFKRRMGYSEPEISNKREALSAVLIPLTMEEEQALLSEAGFEKIAVLFKWFNFASFMALKT